MSLQNDGSFRIGDGDRTAAVAALTTHRETGRLDAAEYERRQVAAMHATTWADVTPLFADLPAPHPDQMPAPAQPATLAGPVEAGGFGGIVPQRYRSTVMALVPLLAVLLFFITESWYWFLAVPIAGILIYGGDERPSRRDRRRDR